MCMDNKISKYVQEARKCLLSQNYGKAYAFYLLVLKLCPQMQKMLVEGFSASWREWSKQLQELGRVDDLFSLYEQGCEIFVECDMLHFYMGNALYHLGMKLEAVNMFRKSLILNENFFEAIVSLENACSGIIDSWHFAMLNDRQRNSLFESAISSSIRDSDIVLDIGSGTGILSMLAVRHGAKNITSCEMSEAMHSIAVETLALNKMNKQIDAQCCHSTKISLEKSKMSHNNNFKFSLVITETVDAGLLGEGIIDTLSHAWKHLLLPPSDGGRVIPHSATLFCCLIESEPIHKKHVLTGKNSFPGVTFTSGVGFRQTTSCGKNDRKGDSVVQNNMVDAFNQSLVGELEPYTSETLKNISHKILSKPQKLFEINFNDPELIDAMAKSRVGNIELDHAIVESGCVDAIAVWFDLALNSDSNAAVINTGIDTCHCWEQAVYPIRFCDVEEKKFTPQRIKAERSDLFSTCFQAHGDCLLLESITRKSCDNLQQYPQFLFGPSNFHVFLPDEQMQRLNDPSFSNMCYRALCDLKCINNPSFILLDISNGFDLIALKTAKTSKINVHKYCQTNSIYNAFTKLAGKCQINVHLHEDLPAENFRCDLILFHVIEPSGLISPNAINNLCDVKGSLSKRGLVIPNRVTLVAQCIESEDLLAKCMVLSDGNTLGLKIADIMNDFRLSTHSDLNTSSLAHSCLSDSVEVLHWNFNDDSSESLMMNRQKSSVVKVTKGGTLHAVLFWFRINVCGDDNLVTRSPENHWKQAAYVFPRKKQLSIKPDDEIVLNTSCRNDSILFRVSRYGS